MTALDVRTGKNALNLWRSMVVQAFDDLHNKKEPWSYFFSPDFCFVCRMAQLDISLVRRAARRFIP